MAVAVRLLTALCIAAALGGGVAGGAQAQGRAASVVTEIVERGPISDTTPVIGTTITITTDNIPAGTPFGANLLFFEVAVPPLDLSVINMPGCFMYGLGSPANIGFSAPGSSVAIPLSIPNDPFLEGATIVSQTFTFSPPLTPLGVISSNGLVLFLAQQ